MQNIMHAYCSYCMQILVAAYELFPIFAVMAS